MRTQTEAKHIAKGKRAVGGGLAQFYAQALLDVVNRFVAVHRLAGFGAAQPQLVTAGWETTEIVIETDDAMHLGFRDVQHVGDHRNRGFIYIAEVFLQCMQYGEQRSVYIFECPDAQKSPIRIEGLYVTH
jgi:hypothetical protein